MCNQIRAVVSSSFVASNMKIAGETGSGEAKLHLGSKSSEAEFDAFFDFDNGYEYKFDRDNLINYMYQVKLEYVYQKINKYKEANIEKWNYYYDMINNMSESEFTINLVKHTDSTRYYVRSENVGIYKIIRSIAVPRITFIVFQKEEEERRISLLLEPKLDYKEDYKTDFDTIFPRNRIIFGAPGTGKSFLLDKDRKELLGELNDTDYERVTFYPDYSYSSFVGTYKPVMKKVKTECNSGSEENSTEADDEHEVISYEYVPGPFMRVYVNALSDARAGIPKPHLLIIEEINRANAAAVFGDMFQLLDRNNNISEYSIQASKDMREYLAKELNCSPEECSTIRIPDNMFIWATMNSADQGVFPMDTAFKRRWSFEYLGVDDGEKDIVPGVFKLNSKNNQEKQKIEWNAFRKALNDLLSSENVRVHEDKLLGPFFINTKKYLRNDSSEDLKDEFVDVISYKVLMYLFEDAAKTKRSSVFVGNANTNRFSVLCNEFKNKGLEIFAKVGKSDFSTVYDGYVSDGHDDCRIHPRELSENSVEDENGGEALTGVDNA